MDKPIMNYTFKTDSGKTATVRANSPEWARTRAYMQYGREYLWAKLTKVTNSL